MKTCKAVTFIQSLKIFSYDFIVCHMLIIREEKLIITKHINHIHYCNENLKFMIWKEK